MKAGISGPEMIHRVNYMHEHKPQNISDPLKSPQNAF